MYTYIYKSWRPKPDDRITSWRAVFLCVWVVRTGIRSHRAGLPIGEKSDGAYLSTTTVQLCLTGNWIRCLWQMPLQLQLCETARLRVCVFHFVSIGCFLHTYTIYIYSGVYIISTTPFYLYADTYIKCSCVYYKKGWWVWDTDRTCSHGS